MLAVVNYILLTTLTLTVICAEVGVIHFFSVAFRFCRCAQEAGGIVSLVTSNGSQK